MKKYISVILSIILLSMKSVDDRKTLLCHNWVQFASRSEMGAPVKPTDASMAKDITFNADGTYQDAIYNNQFKTTGNWYLNEDESKMEFMVSSINGKSAPPFPETTRHYNIIIVKLTADTLIYGDEYYRGKEGGPMVYNHSDLYFVRKD
ncbi:MAG: hypothetical protein ACXVJG_16395 [Mucilaginibacter sp.]